MLKVKLIFKSKNNFQNCFRSKSYCGHSKAIDYYNSKSIDLETKFLETIEDHILIIAKNPFFFKIRYKDYHAFPIKKFPFILFFFIDEKLQTVYIMSMFNTFLNPSKFPK
jgi:hypothetical protein